MSNKKKKDNPVIMIIIGGMLFLLSSVKVIPSYLSFLGIIFVFSGISAYRKQQNSSDKKSKVEELFEPKVLNTNDSKHKDMHMKEKTEKTPRYDSSRYKQKTEKNEYFKYERYCKNCGRSVEKEMKCPECGSIIN